ncbi:hypothetical protein FRC08_001958 [Ceratobasidium sp. 394]|nr:hypothetical protein FRC08_001958 [Ceratobasidium sp. 394]
MHGKQVPRGNEHRKCHGIGTTYWPQTCRFPSSQAYFPSKHSRVMSAAAQTIDLPALEVCNPCWQRRAKCDGGDPHCGTCVSEGHECSWDSESELDSPTLQLVEGLLIKAQILENEIDKLKAKRQNAQSVPINKQPDPQLGNVGQTVSQSSSQAHLEDKIVNVQPSA